MSKKAIIIGAGVAGLTAAYYLEKDGYTIDLIEKSASIGGRIRTDVVNGFFLDHGFQVLLDAYPECQRLLDYDELELKRFASGAIILHEGGRRSKVGDPRKNFAAFFPTLFAKMGSLRDKLKLLSLAKKLNECYIDDLFSQPEEPTSTYLDRKFGDGIKENFFHPFFKGIMLDPELKTSNRVFDFVFKMFGKGYATVPANGMLQLPMHISSKLKRTTIFLNTEVSAIDGHRVMSTEGQTFEGDIIIMATEANALAQSKKGDIKMDYVSNTTVYFSSDKPLGTKNYLVLNSAKGAIVNHLVQMDAVSAAYAPKGKHLIACSILGTKEDSKELIANIKLELKSWFGHDVDGWAHIKTYNIKYALPDQSSVTNELTPEQAIINEYTYICGDHLLNGSINAAMKSGRQVAELIRTSA